MRSGIDDSFCVQTSVESHQLSVLSRLSSQLTMSCQVGYCKAVQSQRRVRRSPVSCLVARDVCGQPRPGCTLWQAVCIQSHSFVFVIHALREA